VGSGRAGDLDRAIALCRDGLKRFPTQLSGRVTLGWALLDQGHYDEARTELEQVLRRAPDNLAAIRGLAELHDRAESAALAVEGNQTWHQESEPAPDAAHATDRGPTTAHQPAVQSRDDDDAAALLSQIQAEMPAASAGIETPAQAVTSRAMAAPLPAAAEEPVQTVEPPQREAVVAASDTVLPEPAAVEPFESAWEDLTVTAGHAEPEPAVEQSDAPLPVPASSPFDGQLITHADLAMSHVPPTEAAESPAPAPTAAAPAWSEMADEAEPAVPAAERAEHEMPVAGPAPRFEAEVPGIDDALDPEVAASPDPELWLETDENEADGLTVDLGAQALSLEAIAAEIGGLTATDEAAAPPAPEEAMALPVVADEAPVIEEEIVALPPSDETIALPVLDQVGPAPMAPESVAMPVIEDEVIALPVLDEVVAAPVAEAPALPVLPPLDAPSALDEAIAAPAAAVVVPLDERRARKQATIAALERFLRKVETRRLQIRSGSVA
jgi:hypothetical protein